MPYQKYQGPALFFRHLDTKNLDWQMNSQPIKSKHLLLDATIKQLQREREREAAHTMAGLNPICPFIAKIQIFQVFILEWNNWFLHTNNKGAFLSQVRHSAQCTVSATICLFGVAAAAAAAAKKQPLKEEQKRQINQNFGTV